MSYIRTLLYTIAFIGISSMGYGLSSDTLVADLRQDVELLRRSMGRYQLEIEALGRENNELRGRLSTLETLHGQASADKENVKKQIAEVAQIDAQERKKIMVVIEEQFDKFVEKTQGVMDSIVANMTAKPDPVKASEPFKFSNDYPKEGVEYSVKSGDTISVIASKHNSTTRDIQNANRIADPKILQAGQVIFVPQRKLNDPKEDHHEKG